MTQRASVRWSEAQAPEPLSLRSRSRVGQWDRGAEAELRQTYRTSTETRHVVCAPGRIRTCDTRFRKPVLYPLSYEGGACRKPGRKPL